ncbi:MAG: ABC transporter ATP-binding protein [Bacteroidales bacterium]|nr:ABC transporter ATP-binding protein [Bacteroidales bacterium]
MIKLEDITFSYRRGVPALIDATAEIGAGINLLLGPNGSGKTTLLKILATTLMPEQGTYQMDGAQMDKRTPSDLSKLFFLSEDEKFPLNTINDMVVHHACFYPTFSIAALRNNLAAYNMSGDEKLSDMSLGQRKKANVAYALALGTDLLMLDEPANGMDIGSKKIFNQLLASNYRDGQIVIIATHTVHDMKNLFDGVIMLNQGHIELCASVERITRRLAFVISSALPPQALYKESDLQGYRAIVINEMAEEETNIDYELLYAALLSPVGEEIVNLIKN